MIIECVRFAGGSAQVAALQRYDRELQNSFNDFECKYPPLLNTGMLVSKDLLNELRTELVTRSIFADIS